MDTIEDVILSHDRRGVAALRPHLPPDFCHQAARFILAEWGPVLIVTGWYVPTVDAAETDGPAGALALGRALEALDFPCYYVADRHAGELLRGTAPDPSRVLDFPLDGHEESRRNAQRLLRRLRPALVVSIERPGLTAEGIYCNIRGEDLSPWVAKLDYLVLEHPRTVAIGDGGNEIGMGNLARQIAEVPGLTFAASTTPCTHLVIASVSNWGAYGLVAALSRIVGRELLPTAEEETALLRRLFSLGAVDGVLARHSETVDSFSLEQNAAVLEQLRALAAA